MCHGTTFLSQTEQVSLPLTAVIPVSLFHDGPFRWRTSTRRIIDAEWLQFDAQSIDADLAEKRRILRDHRDDAFVLVPGSDAACEEVADLVSAALKTENRPPLAPDDRHPLERAARCVHEDLVVLRRQSEGWMMTAGVVCFPTRWSPAAKIGRSMAEIHGPVPRYQSVAATVDRLFDRLRPGAIVWRPNWSLVGDGDLRLPVENRQAPTVLPRDPRRNLWLRAERQTVRRLSDNDDHILFTIRIHRCRLAEVFDEIEAALISELRALPDDVAAYKNLEEWRDELVVALVAGDIG